jgi:purine-cytosine permease-like protein
VPADGQEQFGLLHIMFFAWFANLAMHVGLSDMALFRYAKSPRYGLYSAFGMYLGHMLAWLCSGIMVAAVAREMNPGLMAFEALGLAGALAVLLASWTTANPTLYRAGLALQVVTPGWARWKVTAVAGLVTTILACFPVIFLRLLDYVAHYGLILMPMGAVVFAEHWILPRLGIVRYHTEAKRWLLSPSALVVWPLTLVVAYFVIPVHLYFKWLPGYVFALVVYVALQVIVVRRFPIQRLERAST